MRRRIQALTLAFTAVLAMSAIAAGSGQAASFTLAEGSYPVPLTGEQSLKHVFTVQGQKVECSRAHFAGSLGAASSDLTITPTYTGCSAFGIANAEVKLNSCKYTTTVESGFEPVYTGSVHIACSLWNDSITVNAPATNPLCVVHIPAQTPTTNRVEYWETGSGFVQFEYELSGIHSTVTDLGGFFCPLSTASTDTSGSTTAFSTIYSTEGFKSLHIG